jgi:hypothetical protein
VWGIAICLDHSSSKTLRFGLGTLRFRLIEESFHLIVTGA